MYLGMSQEEVNEIIQKGRDFDLDQLKECGAEAHKLGLKVAAYFILGLPGETRQEVEETICYAKELAKLGVDEVAFGLFIPLPGTPLWGVAKKKNQEMDFLDLLAVGDMNKAVSWNDDIDADELNTLRRKAYLSFYLTKLLHHPLALLKSILNILRSLTETKTERTILQFLYRFKIKKKPLLAEGPHKIGKSLNAYPYDSTVTVKKLLQGKPHYSYGHSLLKTIRILKNDFFSFKK